MSVISLKNITAAYGNKDVLMHFNLEIARGEFVMLIGTSGCGKTTALKLMNGLLRPKEGSVVVNGNDLSRTDLTALRRNLGYVVQETGLFPHLTIEKNISYVADLSRKKDGKAIQNKVTQLLQLVELPEESYTYEQARDLVVEQLAPLGETYRRDLEKLLAGGWVDVYETAGKTTGAYATGVYGVHPYMLLNFVGQLGDVFTLAHEAGHCLHTYYSDTQPYINKDYPIFLAEIASTVNENLLMRGMIAACDAGSEAGRQRKAFLINRYLEEFRGTVFRQTMFAEFELNVGRMAQEGTSLTPEVLNAEYRRLNRLYFGENIVLDHEIDTEWMRIPHFYYNYYVFQYATGYAAAIALSRRILREGTPAVKDYIGFLSGGCSKSPIDLLKGAGVDMSTTKPVEEALSLFGELIGEMEELMKD